MQDDWKIIGQKAADGQAVSGTDGKEAVYEKTRILVAAGIEASRLSLTLLLEKQGYEVETATSLREAGDKARHRFFNMVLLDAGLSGMKGSDLVASLREMRPDLVVVVLTDQSSLETAMKALKDGASATVAKPWDTGELKATVREGLEKQRLIMDNEQLQAEFRQELARRQRSEDRLRKLSLAVKHGPAAVFIYDHEGIIEYVNPRFTDLTGYSPESVLGTHVFDLGENTAGENDQIWKTISAGKEWRGEILNRKESGQHYWVASTISPVKDAAGGVTHFVEVHEDITGRKRAEEEIQAEKDRAQQYLDIAGVAFVALDRDGRIAMVNRQSLNLLESTKADIVGRDWFESCLPDGDRKEARQVFDRQMSGKVEEARKYENLILTKSGRERTVAWNTTVLHNAAGDIMGTLSSGEDITERKQAEGELHRRNRELTLLNQVIIAAASSVGPLSVFETTCRELAMAFDVPQASAALLDETGTKLEVVAEFLAPGRPSSMEVEIPLEGNPASQYVLKNKVPLAVTDAQSDPRMAPVHDLMRERGVVSLLIIPLIVGDRVVGTIGLDALEQREFTEAEMALGNNAAKAAAQVLESARLLEEARLRASHQEALNTIIAESVNATDLKILLETALTQTQRTLGMEFGVISMGGLSCAQGFPQELGQELSQLIQSASTGTMDLSATLVVEDLQRKMPDSRWLEIASLTGNYGIHACITVPITAEGQLFGGLIMADAAPRTWSPEEVSLAEVIGQQLGEAAARLYLLERTKEQAQRIQHIMDTVSEGLLVLDSEQKVALANPLAQEYLAILANGDLEAPLKHLGNKPIEELLGHPSQGAQHHELEVREPTRRIFEVTANSTGTGPLSGGWALALRDVTDVRWQQRYQQQKERLATVGQLAAGIAHDFNNIMAVIVLYSDILLKSDEVSSKTRERLTVINEQAQHAAQLTDQILGFSRSLVMERKPVDMLSFLKGLVTLLERTLAENIGIDLDYDESDHIVNVDVTRLQQAVMNLALNARDAMPNGGTLGLDLRRLTLVTNQRPLVPDMLPGDWIRLIVTDTGSGIEPESLTHIFEPFFTTKAPGEGSGLGLAQVYGIVNQHDGYIDVASKVGAGTTFTIYLPAAVLPRTGPLNPVETAPLVGGHESILLVEDSEATGKAVQAALEGDGYNVLLARNGQEALILFEQHVTEISLVITDLVMPGMGGEALNKMLQDKKPGLKVIVITGYLFDGGGEALVEQGVSDWLQKPFSMDQIALKVRQVLDD